MAKHVGFNPIVRTVENSGVWYCGIFYANDALQSYNKQEVLLDAVVDVDLERIVGFKIYSADEYEICDIELEG